MLILAAGSKSSRGTNFVIFFLCLGVAPFWRPDVTLFWFVGVSSLVYFVRGVKNLNQLSNSLRG